MKLSLKFFCIAYAVVLLSVSAGGILLVSVASDALWDARADRVQTAAGYAVDSFLSFAEASPGGGFDRRIPDITRQIKGVLDGCVDTLRITPADAADGDEPAEGTGLSRFYRDEAGNVMMESACRCTAGTGTYRVAVYSDFGELETYCRRLWSGYGAVALVVAVAGGLLLYWLAARVTRPIKELTQAAQHIAAGDYGATVSVQGGDSEIDDLADSFNAMSRQVDDQIRQIREEVDKRNIFVADFTHELKTPMTAVMGYAQMLDEYDLNSAERRQAAQAIYREAGRLERLSRQLLELYVYRHEGAELCPVALDDIAAQMRATVRFLSEKYGVTCTVTLPGERVLANPELLLSLLYNLTDNAFKASPAGAAITVSGAPGADGVTVRVEDHGRGIAPENLRFITEPFFREDKARSRAMGGAGLGLSLCREIAAIHGTELCFDSTPGVGTTVSFVLRKAGESDDEM